MPSFFDIRTSQAITTYGVGSMVPMGDKGTVMVADLRNWDVNPDEHLTIRDIRLANQCGVEGFAPPPSGRNGDRDIPCVRFPKMVSCPGCHMLQEHQRFQIGPGENRCNDCDIPLVPSRFVIACKDGHIDDFPYRQWVHRNRESAGCFRDLQITTVANTASLSAIIISCECGARESLQGIFDPGSLRGISRCVGREPWKPWVPVSQGFKCESAPHVLQRGAASVWFPVTKSALSIPPWSESFFGRIPQPDMNAFKTILRMRNNLPDVQAVLNGVFENKPYVLNSGFSLEEFVRIVEEALTRNEEVTQTDQTMRVDEFRAIINGQPPESRDDRFVSEGPEPMGPFVRSKVQNLMILPTLTEIRALTGFTRVESKGFDDKVDIKSADLNWLPAIEVRGEGVFLSFSTDAMTSWEKKEDVIACVSRVAEKVPDHREIPVTPRFVLLHTLAHVLIKQWAIDCGYPITSLRERLYADSEDMAGILIYTNGGDSAGSMGGLISQADPQNLDRIFEGALRSAVWCSNDPLCLESPSGIDSVNWGACQACLLLPEPSCEEMNSFLDRRLLIDFENSEIPGYFRM